MIFFNWETMSLMAQGDPRNIIIMVARLTYNLTCHSRDRSKDKLYKVGLRGDSYLLEPELLLRNEKGVSMKYLAEYVGLASYRRYIDYQMANDSTLSVLHTHMDREKIENNPLLYVRNDKIHFKLEEH